MKRTLAFSGATILVAVYACSNDDSTSPRPGSGAQTGAAELALEVAPGVVVTSVEYEIGGADMSAMKGTFALGGGHGSGFIGVVGGIPAGAGRDITLTASASGNVECTGSAPFDVKAGKTSVVKVVLECRSSDGTVVVRGTFDQCPLLKSIAASPDSVPVGEKIALVAVATDPDGDPDSIAWTATSGTFGDASSFTTDYTCVAVGTATLTAAVSKTDGSCSDSASFDVTCTSGADGGALCGNSTVDPGEDCDHSALDGATCATATLNALPNGILACNANCAFDISGCTGANGGGGAGGSGAGGSGAGGTPSTGGAAAGGGTP